MPRAVLPGMRAQGFGRVIWGAVAGTRARAAVAQGRAGRRDGLRRCGRGGQPWFTAGGFNLFVPVLLVLDPCGPRSIFYGLSDSVTAL